MPLTPAILREYPAMNDDQRAVVSYGDGPLLVIAGPGSGKTYSLVLRALNLLLLEKTTPRELVICTYTEKAAFELRDRISGAAQKVGYTGDLSDLRVSTIHGLCNRLLTEHRHRTVLGNNYETLDELTQLLFIFENFKDIIGSDVNGKYLGKWSTKWTAIEGARSYFDKITEELVDPEQVIANAVDPRILQIAQAYLRYQQALFASNRLDFAHLQKLLHHLLQDEEVATTVTRGIKYVLVDEYQDTNYIQEQILLKLSSSTGNFNVVGDEDQSLYRFRGATVRNILEFQTRFPDCGLVKLTTNYRSHKRIVESYDRWMASADWTNPAGLPFRYDKTIEPDLNSEHPDYPAVISIWGQDARDEAKRFAELVEYLKQQEVVQDYSQIALLLRSVRFDHSGPYLEALAGKGIPAFCPRAKAYFEIDSIRLMVACFAVIFGYHGKGRGDLSGQALLELARYVDDCIMELARRCAPPHPLSAEIQALTLEIANLKPGESLDLSPADYFYRILAFEPFASLTKNENHARNLAIFSQLLNAFQNYYHYAVVTYKNREYLRFHLFNSFLRLLHDGGINEYEDPDQPFPLGYVQVMTIHQSKGLEFPVVVVGSLDVNITSGKQIDRDLQRFYHRPPFEPMNRITEFDRMRLHYVAFSRAAKLLVLSTDEQPKPYFGPIWQGLPQWPYVRTEVLGAQRFEIKERMPVKRRYSFTGDLKVYETCPRQYQFFRDYDFTPSRSAVIFFGLLVHQTIEEIHRIVMDGKLSTLSEPRIRELFERTFQFLTLADVRAVGPVAKEAAFTQVMNYFRQNQEDMTRVIDTEVDVSVEKEDYILNGKIDLLMGGDGKLEVLDFKSSKKPSDSPQLLKDYERQLCTYAHILERRYGKHPERLLLYWTAEERKEDALMEFPYRPELVHEAALHFDSVVKKIQAKDFRLVTLPERKICKECDIRSLCAGEHLIQPFMRGE
jgi:DNA helicase-2/ATP-dependent DNA helicase PcrA